MGWSSRLTLDVVREGGKWRLNLRYFRLASPGAVTSIHDLAPSYVHDGLDDGELREFRKHLSDCRRCQEDVALLGGRRSEEAFKRALRLERGSPLHFAVMVFAAAIVVIGLAIYLG